MSKQNDHECHYTNAQILKRFYKLYIKPEKWMICISVICSIIMAISTGVFAFMIEPMLNEIFINKSRSMLYMIPMIVIVNALVRSIASYYQHFCVNSVSQRIVFAMQAALYRHMIYFDMATFDRYPSGKIMSRFTNDMNGIKASVKEVLSNVFVDTISIIALIGVMLYHDLKLSLITFCVLPASAYTIVYFGKKVKIMAYKIYKELGAFSSVLDETFKNIAIVKSHFNERFEINKMEMILKDLLSTYTKAFAISSIAVPMIELFSSVAIVAVIFYAGHSIIDGKGSVGSVFAFASSLIMSYRHIKGLSKINSGINDGVSACASIFQILDEKPSPIDCADAKNADCKFDTIRFDDVSFSYKKRGSILKNVNITIKRGETVALVGRSGVGKSTILQLMQRFYDVKSGGIYIGNDNILNIRMKSLRSMIAVVSQEASLFSGSIYDNIRYGNLKASRRRIENAAKLAAADDFINNLESGYETHVGEIGARLSGGQRQRIAIARAILKDAPILLLDEATSALDAESEKAIQISMANLRKDRTTIIIAHRLSTIINSDSICFIDGGRVIDQGSHDELMKRCKQYFAFYQSYDSI